MNYCNFLKESYLPRGVILLFLLLLFFQTAVPGYLAGHWQWQQPPSVANLGKLRQLRQTGLTVSGWQTLEQSQQQIGEHKWSFQLLQKQGTDTKAILLLLPQTASKNQPQAEWTEINSWGKFQWEQWNVAQNRWAEFTVKQVQKNGLTRKTKVTARFFRAATNKQTFAVLQWYAWQNGGHPSPLQWLLADRTAQLHRQRAAWVAVSIFMPMEPFGNIETVRTEMQSMGKTVQAALMANIFPESS
jgi:cyanoexosortase B-associated protein